MKIYRVIEECYDYGEYNEYHTKSFIKPEDAELFVVKCNEAEDELLEQALKCNKCIYGFGQEMPCEELDLIDSVCCGFISDYIKSTFRIDEEEVVE